MTFNRRIFFKKKSTIDQDLLHLGSEDQIALYLLNPK